MAEENEIDEKNLKEKEEDFFDYSQVDPLTAIGYIAEPGSIYYIQPSKELSSYPMYIENPQKIEKRVGAYIAYTLNGTDITAQTTRRYSDFFALYEKLVQRWPGIYVPPIPPKLIAKNTSRKKIKHRMRLLNRFCLNLSNIDYLYSCEETSLFKRNTPDLASAISKLPELTNDEYLKRLKEAFPNHNEEYDILIGKGVIIDFEVFLKKSLKNVEMFEKCVENAAEKREQEIKNYFELIKGLVEYEKNSINVFCDDNFNSLIFNNSAYKELAEKVEKLKNRMINPYTAFKDWLEEETLDAEAMLTTIKGIYELIEKEEKLKQKVGAIEADIKNLEGGRSSLKQLFKKKEAVIAIKQKEKDEHLEKFHNFELIVKIVAENLENQIGEFKKSKTQTYYKYLKIFAILQRESNKAIRELWSLVQKALSEVAPNAYQANGDYVAKPMSTEQNDEEQLDADVDDVEEN